MNVEIDKLRKQNLFLIKQYLTLENQLKLNYK